MYNSTKVNENRAWNGRQIRSIRRKKNTFYDAFERAKRHSEPRVKKREKAQQVRCLFTILVKLLRPPKRRRGEGMYTYVGIYFSTWRNVNSASFLTSLQRVYDSRMTSWPLRPSKLALKIICPSWKASSFVYPSKVWAVFVYCLKIYQNSPKADFFLLMTL